MALVKRQMIKIDEDLCNGCGLCIPACPEGALEIIDGKAKLVKETFCDGLGACLGDCPEGALEIQEKLVEEYDEQGVLNHLQKKSPELMEKHIQHLQKHGIGPAIQNPDNKPKSAPQPMGCPSAQMQSWGENKSLDDLPIKQKSQLRQWPIQLHLVPPSAPYFKSSDIMFVADCVPFAYGNFHQDFLNKYSIAIACPKLDNVQPYVDKISQIIQAADPKSLNVAIMEVPCCTGLVHIVLQAIADSGKIKPLNMVKFGIKGDVLDKQEIDVEAVLQNMK